MLTSKLHRWMKAHGRITAQTIKDQYEKKFPLGERLVLKHESKVLVNLESSMSDLDTYNDKVIAFEAVRVSASARLVPARQPLKPRNAQTFSPPPQKFAVGLDGTQENGPPTGPRRLNSNPVPYGSAGMRHSITPGQSSASPHESSRYSSPYAHHLVPPTDVSQMSGFDRFKESVLGGMRISYQGYSDAQIQESIRRSWEAMAPTQRARESPDSTPDKISGSKTLVSNRLALTVHSVSRKAKLTLNST